MKISFVQIPGETVWHVHINGAHVTGLCAATLAGSMRAVRNHVRKLERTRRKHEVEAMQRGQR